MKTSKIVGIVIIVLSMAVGYVGLNKIADNTREINLLGIKIDASNESGKQQGILYTGLAILLFAGGLYLVKKGE